MSGDGTSQRSLLCFAGNDWWVHNPYTEKQWMRCLAGRSWRILFVNSIGIGLPSPRSPKMAKRVFRKLFSMLRWLRRSEGVWVLTPLILPFWSFRTVARLNTLLLAAQIRLLLLLLRMPRPLFWSGIPTAALLLDSIPHEAVVYYYQDHFTAYYDTMLFSRVPEWHEALMRRADMVLYASTGLMDLHPGPAPARRIPHGVEDHFLTVGVAANHPPPPELASLPHPIVGYWGSLEALQDIALIAALARLRPAWSFVFIGRPMFDAAPLRELQNITFTGYLPYERLTEFGIHFDVAIIPMVQTPWVLYSNPVKLREYYALGKAVVSVPIIEFERNFPDARIARTAGEFAAAIEDALAQDCEEERLRRRRAVEGLTWSATAAQVDSMLRGLSAPQADHD